MRVPRSYQLRWQVSPIVFFLFEYTYIYIHSLYYAYTDIVTATLINFLDILRLFRRRKTFDLYTNPEWRANHLRDAWHVYACVETKYVIGDLHLTVEKINWKKKIIIIRIINETSILVHVQLLVFDNFWFESARKDFQGGFLRDAWKFYDI